MRPLADHGEHSYVGHGRLEGQGRADHRRRLGHRPRRGDRVRARRCRRPCSYLERGRRRRRDEAARRGGRAPLRDRCRGHRRPRTLPALVDRTFERFGRLDVLVNNAAFQVSHELVPGDPAGRADFVFARTCWRCSISARPPCRGWEPARRSSTRRRYRPRSRAPSCCTTPPPRARSAPSPRASRRSSRNAASVSTRSRPGRSGRRWWSMSFPAEKNAEFGADTPLRPSRPARRAGAAVRVPRDRRLALHQRRGDRRDRRQAAALSRSSRDSSAEAAVVHRGSLRSGG